jgi:hypothetical protein
MVVTSCFGKGTISMKVDGCHEKLMLSIEVTEPL